MTSPKPFRVDVPQSKLDWIADRVANAHIGYAPDDDADWKYGTDARYLAEFRDYWRDDYDWRAAEAAFNAFPQFTVPINGIDVHFYHVRAEGGEGYPLILTHGWPGSVLEFLEVIPLLTARGYDVVVPSLPGYGFSGRPSRPIGAAEIADMWRTLMVDILGYPRFGAQGGDWGATVTTQLAERHADVLDAFHVNILFFRQQGDMTPEEVDYLKAARKRYTDVGAYTQQMQTRPQTIGLALADSPIGFASWVLEKYRAWSDCHGDLETSLSKQALVTAIMTFLVSDNVQASMWLYNSLTAKGNRRNPEPVAVPMGFAEFPGETVPPPRAAMERSFDIRRWTKMPRGGHFAAWEVPDIFAAEIAEFFDAWRGGQ